jgi:hypothetical protein
MHGFAHAARQSTCNHGSFAGTWASQSTRHPPAASARRVGARYAQSALLEQQCVASRPAADLPHERTAGKCGDQAVQQRHDGPGPAVCAR